MERKSPWVNGEGRRSLGWRGELDAPETGGREDTWGREGEAP